MPFCVRAVVQTASLMVFIFKKFIMVGFKIKCMLRNLVDFEALVSQRFHNRRTPKSCSSTCGAGTGPIAGYIRLFLSPVYAGLDET